MVRIFRDKKGYKRFSGSKKPVHRWVASKMLGRPLKKREKVHHKNRKPWDNRWKNLRVFPNQKAHYKPHKRNKKKFRFW